jgi:PST family polysaccharide transporter
LTAADVVARVAAAAFMALAARRLGTEGYGLYATAVAFLVVARLAGRVGLQGVLVVRDVAQRRDRAAEYLASAAALSLATALVLAVALPLVGRALGYQAELLPLLALAGLALVGNAMARPAEDVLRAHEAMGALAAVGVGLSLGTAAAGLGLLALGVGVTGLFLLQVLAAWVEAGLLAVLVARQGVRLGLRPSLGVIRRLVREGLVVFVLVLLDLLATRSDVLLLARLAGPAAVGLYVPALRVIEYLTLFRGGAMAALFPFLAARVAETPGSLPRAFGEVRRLFALYGVGVAVALTFGAEAILGLVLGTAFVPGAAALRLLAWAMACDMLGGPLAEVLVIARQPLLPLAPALLGLAVVNVSLNLWLLPRLAHVAPAVAALATALGSLVLRAVWARRLFGAEAPRLWVAAWPPGAAGLAAAGAFALLRPVGFWASAPLAGVIYLATLAAVGGLRPADLQRVRALGRRAPAAPGAAGP